MLQCGGCTVQQAQQAVNVLLNPATWMVLIGGWYALTSVVSKKKGDKK